MERYIIKIQSLSDIITNSSSEVFPIVRYKWGAEDDIKRLINAILTAGGSDYTCEDLFDIEVDGSFLNVTPKITTKNVEIAAAFLANLDNLFEPWDE